MVFDLKKTAAHHRIIVAHRGVSGGNIPCNTRGAYRAALMMGADMLETDVTKGGDGVFYVLHPGMEREHLGVALKLEEADGDTIGGLYYRNPSDHVPTRFPLMKFEELLEEFKGKCYINVDKFWSDPKGIYEVIKRHGVQDQVLVKSSPSDTVYEILEQLCPSLPFMPIVDDTDFHEVLMRRNINYVGAELLFFKDSDPVVSEEFLDRLHKDGKLAWANSIIYNYKSQIAAGHSDDTAITESEEKGWGWLANRGFDIIQTDWPSLLIDFLKRTDRYYK